MHRASSGRSFSLACGVIAFMARICITLLSFACLLLFVSSMPCFYVSPGADTISPGHSISGNQTVASNHGTFEMGFFTLGNSHNYYVGIWYKGIIPLTVAWVANREAPLKGTSHFELKISGDGNLVIVSDHRQIPVWSSNSTHPSPASSVAVLLETGNLILIDRSNCPAVLWQSFDHPTDTLLPTMGLGLNRVTGENQFITSWRNLEDPAPGPFSFMLGGGESKEFFLVWNKTEPYWSTGNRTGGYFSLLPETRAGSNFINTTFVDDQRGKYASVVMVPTILGRGKVDVDGQLKYWIWVSSSQKWSQIWSAPSSHCALYICGAFSICDGRNTLPCKCLHGFEPASARDWELKDWSGGCERRTSLQYCEGNTSMEGTQDGFLGLPNLQLRGNPRTLAVGSARECESACLSSCNCSAYSFQGGCSIWAGDLLNLQQLSEGDDAGRTLFLRLAASELTRSNRKKKTAIKVTVGTAALGILALVSIVLGIAWWNRRRSTSKADGVLGSLVQFPFGDLKTVTKNFSEILGKGGFGSVYKGMLHGSTLVAVKRLEGHRQGEKQFRSELSILGTVQHVNLVPLRGFCIQGSERLLVYDYMPNGSLDCHLFGNNLASIVSWKRRFQIILGVAKGVAYLHESCREKIIHCDIKPENILLNAEFCPKVADFGLAKLFGRDFSRVLTTMRGTVGYLAPEWISGTAITTKADVYSYGMMLLEIISGRRNTEEFGDGDLNFFPIWAAAKVCKGDVLSIADEKLGRDDIDMEELTRASRVACWCIQDSEVHRPYMGLAVKILEGSVDVDVPPVPRFLQLLV